MPMLCKKFFIRQSVCCFVFGFILLFIPSGLTYLNGQQNRESEFITDLVSDIISLADDEASENLSISDDVTLPVKGATGDQTRINSIKLVAAAYVSNIEKEKITGYLESYFRYPDRSVDSIVMNWTEQKARIAALELVIEKNEQDSVISTVAVFSLHGKLLFDGILSNLISEVADIKSIPAIDPGAAGTVAASARVTSLTGSVTLHWRVTFNAQSSPFIDPDNEGLFSLSTTEITCWRTDPSGIPPQGEPVVYFGANGTSDDFNDPFESRINLLSTDDHFGEGIYRSEVSDGQDNSWSATYNATYDGNLSISAPDVPETPLWLACLTSTGQSVSILNKVYGNPVEKKYKGIFLNSGSLKLEDLTIRAEEGGNETGTITAEIPVNCAYSLWNALPIFQDVLYAGQANLSLDYIRSHSLPDPQCSFTATDYSITEGQQTTLTVRVFNPGKVADMINGSVTIDLSSLGGKLSVGGNSSIQIDTIKAGQYSEYSFLLEGISPGDAIPGATITWQWGCPDIGSVNILSQSISLDRNIEILPVPSITVTSPNGAESIQSGRIHTITWTSNNRGARVDLEFSSDNGNNWIDIGNSEALTGSFAWLVPALRSTTCLIRVIDNIGNVSDQSNSVFTVSDIPVVTVASPNGGEMWEPESMHQIIWSSFGTSGDVQISYSIDNGAEWTEIAVSTPDDGIFEWTTPEIRSSACLVRINDTDGNPADRSNSVFTISQSPAIEIITPDGGESWEAGSSQNIVWTSSGTSGNVRLQYSLDNGAGWTEIINSTPDDGSFTWTVPYVHSSACLLQIIDAEGSTRDRSDSVFIIAFPPAISISSPDGSEIWLSGTTHPIVWSSVGTSGRINILYSIDNGTSWSEIVSDTPDDGRHDWIIPGVPSENCLVLIRDADGHPEDQSNAVFTITDVCSPAIIMTQPSDKRICALKEDAAFEVTVSGLAPFRFQWQINENGSWLNTADGVPAGALYSGGNTNKLSVTGISEAGVHQYRCHIENCLSAGTESRTVSLTVMPAVPDPPIAVTVQPTCNAPDGSLILNGLPPEGTWTLTQFPELTTITGRGTTTAITGLKPGFYSYAVMNESGCSSDKSMEIEIMEGDPGVIPEITLKYDDILICYNLGDSLTSYQWYEGQYPIPDASLQYYQTHKQPGTYRVFTLDRDGCGNFSDPLTISGARSLVAYPNPASAFLGLKLNDQYEGTARIRILNSSGIKEFEKSMKNATNELISMIPVEDLKPGIYLIQVLLDNNEILYSKVMISK